MKDPFNILPAGLTSIFGLMQVCEQEIEQAQVHHPDQSDRLWKYGFLLCCPTGNMSRLSDKV